MAISAVDLELKQAFTELHVNTIESTKKLKMIDVQLDVFKNSKKKYEITKEEIKTLPADTKVYSSIGRMFVLSTPTEMCAELENKGKKCEGMVDQLAEKKNYLINCLKEQEDNLRDLVKQKKDAENKKRRMAYMN